MNSLYSIAIRFTFRTPSMTAQLLQNTFTSGISACKLKPTIISCALDNAGAALSPFKVNNVILCA